MVSAGHLIQGIEDAKTAVIQVFLDEFTPRPVRQILFRPIFAGEKSAGKREVGDHAHSLFQAKRFELRFIICTIVEVV